MYIHAGFQLYLDMINERMRRELKYLAKGHVARKFIDKEGKEVEQDIIVYIRLTRRPYATMIHVEKEGWKDNPSKEDSIRESKKIHSWFQKHSTEDTYATITHIFPDYENQVMVGEATIDKKLVYIIMSSKTKHIPPIMLKKLAQTGDLGNRVSLPMPIQVLCRAYIYDYRQGFLY